MKPAAESIRCMLTAGDPRSIGRADEVAELVCSNHRKLPSLVRCLWDEVPEVRARAANALEKVCRTVSLQRYKSQLIGLLAEVTQPQVRWQLALIVPRLRLSRPECRYVAGLLQTCLKDRTSLEKTFAMQGLADLARQDSTLLTPLTEMVQSLSRTGTAAMRARGRILLRQLIS